MDALDTVMAERAITAQLLNYCRAMDRCDEDLGLAVFHPDAVLDYGTMFQGSGAEFVAFSTRAHGQFLSHLHRVTNVVIALSGERAGSEAYVDAQFRSLEDGQHYDIYTRGRYLDRWERREGHWAIVHRQYVNAMAGRRRIDEIPFGVDGTRDRADPSYAILAADDGGSR